MVGDLPAHRITVGGDKAYDTREFVQSLRDLYPFFKVDSMVIIITNEYDQSSEHVYF